MYMFNVACVPCHFWFMRKGQALGTTLKLYFTDVHSCMPNIPGMLCMLVGFCFLFQHKDNFTFPCHHSEFHGSKIGDQPNFGAMKLGVAICKSKVVFVLNQLYFPCGY